MPTCPSEFQAVIIPYVRLFSRRVFAHAPLLLLGAVLAPGKRTVTAALRIVGLDQQPGWHKYHRVLSRARWSARAASHVLLSQLVAAFLPAGPLVFDLDETLERRWGPRTAARGIYRDAVRSGGAHLVKCSGLRWRSRCLLTPLLWAARLWALPVLTVLAPSADWAQARGQRHKKVTDWARQLARWLPGRRLICLGDSGYAVLDSLAAAPPRVCWLARLRLDAARYAPAPSRRTGQLDRPRVKGGRLPGLAQLAADAATDWQALTLPRLPRVQQNYLRVETLTAANAQPVDGRVQLPLAQPWGGGEVASADGMRFVVPVRTLHAGWNRKYFAAERSITYYNFTSDQFSGFHGIFISGTLRDSLFLLAGLLEQQTRLDPREIMTDTHGLSEAAFTAPRHQCCWRWGCTSFF